MKRVVILVFVIISLSSCSKYAYKLANRHGPYDAIIVPGVPFNGKEWEDVMKMRVYWSYLLFQRGMTKNIIYSGSAVYTPYYESEIMKLYALKLGIPEKTTTTSSMTTVPEVDFNIAYVAILSSLLVIVLIQKKRY